MTRTPTCDVMCDVIGQRCHHQKSMNQSDFYTPVSKMVTLVIRHRGGGGGGGGAQRSCIHTGGVASWQACGVKV